MTGSPRDFQQWMRQMERAVKSAQRGALHSGTELRELIEALPPGVKAGTPTAPVEITFQTAVYFDQHQSRRWRGRIYVDFPDVVRTTDARPITVTSYELQAYRPTEVPEGGTPVWQTLGFSGISSFINSDLVPGAVYRFRVRAERGVWSEEFEALIDGDTTPPPQPTAPKVTAGRGAIIIEWDGLAVTGQMPADFAYLILAAGTDPSPTAEIARLDEVSKLHVHAGAAYYTPMFFRLRAVDQAGNLSPWSEQGTAVLTPLVDVDVILTKIDAAKTQIDNAGRIILETGIELGTKLADADTAIDAAATGLATLSGRVGPVEAGLDSIQKVTLPDIITSVNGKNSTFRKTAAPAADDTTGIVGDRWEFWSNLNANGRLMATYRRQSTGWIQELIDPTYLPKVDIGEGTFGSLAGGRIAVNSLSVQHLLVGLGENMIPWKASDADTTVQSWEPHAAYAGTIFKLDRVGGRTGGPHGLMEGVIPASTDTATLEFRSGYIARNGFVGHFNVEPSTKYKVTMWIRSGGVYPSGAPNVWLYSQSYLANKSVESGSGRASARQVLTSGWEPLKFEFTTAPNAASLVLRLMQDQPGHIRIEDPFMARDGAALIAAGGINATHIDAASVAAAVGQFVHADIGKLIVTAGATMNSAVIDHLWTNVVRSRSITTDMLAVGSGPNAIADPFFENEAIKSTRRGRSGQWGAWGRNTTLNLNWYGASGLAAVANSFYFDAGADAYAPGSMIAVEEGQKWRLKVKTNSTGGGARATARVLYKNGTMGYTAVGWTTTTGGGNGFSPVGVQDVERIYTVPADVAYIIPAVQFQPEATAAYVYGGATFGDMTTPSMIVDGAILTRHLTVTDDMVVKFLQVHKVQAGEIEVNNLAADTGFIGSLRTHLVTADLFTGKAFDGGTFTGSVFRTSVGASTTGGVQFDTNGIRAWNTSGSTTFHLNGPNGNLSIFGGTLTSPTIQTTSAAARGIKFTAAHIAAYSSTGKQTFLLDAAEGDAMFDSRVGFGSKTAPKWIIVPGDTDGGRVGIWMVNPAVSASGIGGSETGGMFMDASASTTANPLKLRGANGGPVNIASGFEVNGSSTLNTITHAGGLYEIRGANGSFFNSQVIFRGRIAYEGAPSTTQAANAHIGSADGTIWISSSASRYKVDPRPMVLPDSLLDVPIEDWIDRGQLEERTALAASPQPHTKEVTEKLARITLERVPGAIAEKVEAAGGRGFVGYDRDGRVETLFYDRFALARTAILKRQLDAAIARIEILEGMMR